MKKKDFCDIVLLSEGTKILEFNPYQKSNKARFIICGNSLLSFFVFL